MLQENEQQFAKIHYGTLPTKMCPWHIIAFSLLILFSLFIMLSQPRARNESVLVPSIILVSQIIASLPLLPLSWWYIPTHAQVIVYLLLKNSRNTSICLYAFCPTNTKLDIRIVYHILAGQRLIALPCLICLAKQRYSRYLLFLYWGGKTMTWSAISA